MSWESVLKNEPHIDWFNHIEKNVFSRFADKVAPQRVENRKQDARNDAIMAVGRQRQQARPEMIKQLFNEWINSNPTSWPDGEELISAEDAMRQHGNQMIRDNKMEGTIDNTPNTVVKPENNETEMQTWNMKGGHKEVFQALVRKFPEPKPDWLIQAEAQYNR
tara:strand:- start:302 stop:790 length:489 start_codon:yes stop_codon:yes gene_type:complete